MISNTLETDGRKENVSNARNHGYLGTIGYANSETKFI
jgi:hypothetical protein